MRIIVSAYACEPKQSSEAATGWNWAHGLAKRGHEVYLLTRVHGRLAIEHELDVHPMPNLHVTYVDIPEWSKRYLKGQLGVFAHYFLWQRAALNSARKMKEDIDLVHHVTWGSLHGGSHLWKLRIPFVFGPIGGGQTTASTFRGFFGREWAREWFRSSFTKALVYNPLSRRLFSNSDLILATNQETLSLARRLGARRAELFFDTGLPEEFFPAALQARHTSNELRVLWVGRLYPRKALPLALMAVREAVDMGVPVRLTVVGDGPLGIKVSDWIRQYGLSGRVDWRGQVPREKVREAYATHDVFLFASVRDSCPVQLLEAMTFGLPIVTLNHQGARDLVPDQAGIKVPVTSLAEIAKHLAEGLAFVWQDPRKAEEMGKLGFEFAQGQTMSKRIARMETLYESVV